MNSDILLVGGLIVGALAIPALLNAWVEGHVPRAGSIMVMISTGLIVLALYQKPSGYKVEEVPEVFFRVLGRLLN
jgi:hypothetical protein